MMERGQQFSRFPAYGAAEAALRRSGYAPSPIPEPSARPEGPRFPDGSLTVKEHDANYFNNYQKLLKHSIKTPLTDPYKEKLRQKEMSKLESDVSMARNRKSHRQRLLEEHKETMSKYPPANTAESAVKDRKDLKNGTGAYEF